ncbi:hypothetical protein [Halovivax limisalsi]|uniref:hypothetical protein n=1 Tax=Halovivax limisalsi TaxID=1453760 RepID=UPI001FFCCBEA|nr:hypothetical protein [Halovivax limisalsi]
MFEKLTDPVRETLVDGAIVNRLLLVVGVVLVLYGAYEILGVYADIWNQLVPSDPYDPLEPVLRSFAAVVVGVIVFTLAVVLDFSWNPEPEH